MKRIFITLCAFMAFTASIYPHKENDIMQNEKKMQEQQLDVKENATKNLTFTVNGVSFIMIFVEHGTFTMGATAEMQNSDFDEKPVHQVTLTNDYYIGETEVTQGLWKAVTGYSLKTWHNYKWAGDDYPIWYVTYEHMMIFIEKLNTLTGKTFRLPTEAEWEFAARGGNKSKGFQYSGSNTIDDVAWYKENSDNGWESPDHGIHIVKTKLPNELGIYDMSGNVDEMCSDWFGPYISAPQTNPTGPSTGWNRVERGGSWCDRHCHSSHRYDCIINGLNDHGGFRLVLSE